MKSKIFLTLLLFLTSLLFTFSSSCQTLSQDSTKVHGAIPEPGLGVQIENINATPKTEGFDLSWNINYNAVQQLKDAGYSISIAYDTKLNTDRKKKKKIDHPDQRIDGLEIGTTNYAVHKLAGDEKYAFRIGLTKGSNTYWSEYKEVKTKSSWGVFNFFVLLGSLGLFLYGMKIMSDGLQQAAGSKLRNLLGSITSNPVKGILTGFGVTALIQSSSITTVMTVSFVNAGILTLTQSAGVVMGANIGTTVTAWIVDLLGFKVDIAPYTLIILAAGLPLLFAHSSKTKGWGNAIVGLALLFMGLGYIKAAVPELGADSALVRFFVSLNDIPYLGTIICVIFGAVLTIIIQSSSATIALTMALMATGIIPFGVGAAMVLGENIGTTITAEIAASVGNVYAKRTARIHSLFNIIGVTWVVIIFPLFIKGITFITEAIGGGNPVLDPLTAGSTGLAVLHTTFNLANVMILIWFVPGLVKLSEKSVKSKGGEDEQFRLDYIGTSSFNTPELSILEAKRELAKFGELTARMSKFTRDMLFENDRKNQRQFAARIKKYEEITDRVELEVANYLNHISEGAMDEKLAVRIQGMNRIASNLERIGDIFFQISMALSKNEEDKIKFTDLQKQRLSEILDLIDNAFLTMCDNLNKHSEEVTLDEARSLEEQINMKRDELRREYYETLSELEKSNVKRGLLYSNVFASLERIGDHIINVTEGIKGKT